MSIVKAICNSNDPQKTALEILQGTDAYSSPRSARETRATIVSTIYSLGLEVNQEIKDQMDRIKEQLQYDCNS